MPYQPALARPASPPSPCEPIACPLQILVIDRLNGPASILVDTVSLLLDREISVTSVEDHADALRILHYYPFDLIVIGLQATQPIQLAVLPYLRAHDPERPILGVGRNLPDLYQQYARRCGADEVLDMPQNAAELKALVRCMAECYLK